MWIKEISEIIFMITKLQTTYIYLALNKKLIKDLGGRKRMEII
jgi:hypothetical protein